MEVDTGFVLLHDDGVSIGDGSSDREEVSDCVRNDYEGVRLDVVGEGLCVCEQAADEITAMGGSAGASLEATHGCVVFARVSEE